MLSSIFPCRRCQDNKKSPFASPYEEDDDEDEEEEYEDLLRLQPWEDPEGLLQQFLTQTDTRHSAWFVLKTVLLHHTELEIADLEQLWHACQKEEARNENHPLLWSCRNPSTKVAVVAFFTRATPSSVSNKDEHGWYPLQVGVVHHVTLPVLQYLVFVAPKALLWQQEGSSDQPWNTLSLAIAYEAPWDVVEFLEYAVENANELVDWLSDHSRLLQRLERAEDTIRHVQTSERRIPKVRLLEAQRRLAFLQPFGEMARGVFVAKHTPKPSIKEQSEDDTILGSLQDSEDDYHHHRRHRKTTSRGAKPRTPLTIPSAMKSSNRSPSTTKKRVTYRERLESSDSLESYSIMNGIDFGATPLDEVNYDIKEKARTPQTQFSYSSGEEEEYKHDRRGFQSNVAAKRYYSSDDSDNYNDYRHYSHPLKGDQDEDDMVDNKAWQKKDFESPPRFRNRNRRSRAKAASSRQGASKKWQESESEEDEIDFMARARRPPNGFGAAKVEKSRSNESELERPLKLPSVDSDEEDEYDWMLEAQKQRRKAKGSSLPTNPSDLWQEDDFVLGGSSRAEEQRRQRNRLAHLNQVHPRRKSYSGRMEMHSDDEVDDVLLGSRNLNRGFSDRYKTEQSTSGDTTKPTGAYGSWQSPEVTPIRSKERTLEQLLVPEHYDELILWQLLHDNPELCQTPLPNKKDENRLFPLSLACCCQPSLQFIQFMVKAHPSALKDAAHTTTTRMVEGWLPLHFACHYRAPVAVVRCLLSEYPRGAQKPDTRGWLPLHVALASYFLDGGDFREGEKVIWDLLSSHPRGVRHESNRGILPVHVLARSTSSENDEDNAIVSRLDRFLHQVTFEPEGTWDDRFVWAMEVVRDPTSSRRRVSASEATGKDDEFDAKGKWQGASVAKQLQFPSPIEKSAPVKRTISDRHFVAPSSTRSTTTPLDEYRSPVNMFQDSDDVNLDESSDFKTPLGEFKTPRTFTAPLIGDISRDSEESSEDERVQQEQKAPREADAGVESSSPAAATNATEATESEQGRLPTDNIASSSPVATPVLQRPTKMGIVAMPSPSTSPTASPESQEMIQAPAILVVDGSTASTSSIVSKSSYAPESNRDPSEDLPSFDQESRSIEEHGLSPSVIKREDHNKLWKLLSDSPYDENAICDYIQKNPDSCRLKYRVNVRSRWLDLFPLSIVCTLQPSSRAVRIVHDANRDAISQPERSCGWLPLHLACGSNASLEVVQYLAFHYPTAIQVTDLDGWLPLHMACASPEGGSWQIIQYLTSLYPQGLTKDTNDGYTPTQLAVAYGAPTGITEMLTRAEREMELLSSTARPPRPRRQAKADQSERQTLFGRVAKPQSEDVLYVKRFEDAKDLQVLGREIEQGHFTR